MKRNRIVILLLVVALCLFFIACSPRVTAARAEADKLLIEAQNLAKQGDYEESILLYDQVLKIEPKNFEAQFGLGKAYRVDKQFDKAIKALKAAQNMNPKNSDVVLELGGALIDNGMIIEAETLLLPYFTVDEVSEQAKRLLQEAYADQQKARLATSDVAAQTPGAEADPNPEETPEPDRLDTDAQGSGEEARLAVEVITAQSIAETQSCTHQYCLNNGKNQFTAEVPKIDSDLPGAMQLNAAIYERCIQDKSRILGPDGGEETITYKAVKDRDMLTILLYIRPIGCESGEGPRYYEVYHYNMRTDQVLNNSQYASYYGLTEEALVSRAKKLYAEIEYTEDWYGGADSAVNGNKFYIENGKIYFALSNGLMWDQFFEIGGV